MQQRTISSDSARSDDLRRQNRHRILNAVRFHTSISRTDISEFTGLSAATVSAITSELIDSEVLALSTSDVMHQPKRGRPKTKLELNPLVGRVGALNLQLNFVSAAVADYAMEVQAESSVRIDTLNASQRSLREALAKCLKAAISQLPKQQQHINQISLGVQGTIDAAGETLLWSPISRQINLPMKRWLETTFDVNARVFNDADLIALALHRMYPEQYGNNFAAILLGHGVGMGLFLNGSPIHGTRSSATEFGHMVHMPGGALCRCGGHGCIEAYAGDYAMVRHALGKPHDEAPLSVVETRQLVELVNDATAGDQRAIEAIALAGNALGHGIASMYALLDPFPLAFVGTGTAIRDFMEPALRKAISQSVAARWGGATVAEATDHQKIEYFTDGNQLVQSGGVYRGVEALDQEFASADL